MTDAEILTLATRHNIVDKFDVRPRAEEVIAFARDLAGAVMAELGERGPGVPAVLDWRATPRAVPDNRDLPAGSNPMSDSDLAPLK
jgi:hypothetical protein